MLLASYALQAEVGDYNQTVHGSDYFVPEHYLPQRVSFNLNQMATFLLRHRHRRCPDTRNQMLGKIHCVFLMFLVRFVNILFTHFLLEAVRRPKLVSTYVRLTANIDIALWWPTLSEMWSGRWTKLSGVVIVDVVVIAVVFVTLSVSRVCFICEGKILFQVRVSLSKKRKMYHGPTDITGMKRSWISFTCSWIIPFFLRLFEGNRQTYCFLHKEASSSDA